MFLKPISDVVERLVKVLRILGKGCNKVFVSASGGVDSTVVAGLLCEAFGPGNTVVMFRDIYSDEKHLKDVMELQKALRFKFVKIDANEIYDGFLAQCWEQFSQNDLPWSTEGSQEAEKNGFSSAYASLKSRFTTPFAGFISKAIDNGGGRIFGTGNGEEDVFLRYFDKYGDGAVDNNILNGFTKMEVRQLAIWFGEKYEAEIFVKIAKKTPSADLHGDGDQHNDEDELSSWAKRMGYDINLSYGDLEKEGNIAWLMKENLSTGVIIGERSCWTRFGLALEYTSEEVELILFVREIEKSTRHKENTNIPGLPRNILREEGYVD
jgi:NAD+ synthetase